MGFFERDFLDLIVHGDPNRPQYFEAASLYLREMGNSICNQTISTPKDSNIGQELLGQRVNRIVELLVGVGSPWQGITSVRR